MTSTSKLSQRYVQAGRGAAAAGQWKSATLYYERALELGVRDRELLFDLAIAADKSGDESRKVAVLERLSPDDSAVYAPAHLWKALQALSTSPVPPEKLAMAEKQLRFAIAIDPSNDSAHAILGDMYFQRGFMDGAVTHLGRASKADAKYQLLLAKSCALTGRAFEAESSGKLAKRLSEAKLGENPNDLTARLELAESLLFLEQYEESLKVLSSGLSLVKDSAPLRHAAAKVYLIWADSVLKKPGDKQTNRSVAFQLVAAGMQQNPDDVAVFDRMMELVSVDDEASANARDFLLDNIATGRAVGMSHLLLGTSLQEAGDLARAGFHLEQAFNLMPQAPIVANNLAWHLSHQEKPASERAMKLIQAVIDRFPGIPAYIDTRAHVYLSLGEWKKAVDDFQVSMSQFANEQSVHAGLVTAYEHLGMTELAERHRKIAARLQARTLATAPRVPSRLPEEQPQSTVVP